jgi:adenosylcobinamide kinase/adenosylcobinamide-phosphate guanylyltransferase
MARVMLITGGARSGKSSLALSLAKKYSGKRLFIATAEAIDNEMRGRIERHRASRDGDFETAESPAELAGSIRDIPPEVSVAVIDCLTVWLGNMYHRHGSERSRVGKEMETLAGAIGAARCDLVIVTNEVGWGIVPGNEMGRAFRDDAGYLNRLVASLAADVYLCVCGIAQKIKGEK